MAPAYTFPTDEHPVAAKVIADSITEEGHRLISVQETFWRPVLAERNTTTRVGGGDTAACARITSRYDSTAPAAMRIRSATPRIARIRRMLRRPRA